MAIINENPGMYPVRLDCQLSLPQYEQLKALLDTFGINIAGEEGKVVVSFHLTRTRTEENEYWTNAFFLLLDRKEYEQYRQADWENPDFLVSVLKDRIAKSLASADGWDSIVESCCDYNWGDWVNDMPMADVGLYDNTNDITGNPVVAYCDILVRQDEFLAPDSVPVTLVLEKDGEELGSYQLIANFQDGNLEDRDGIVDEETIKAADKGYVRLDNGDIIQCDPEEDFLRLQRD